MMAAIDRQMGSQSGTAGRTILVVDDSDDLRELYETLLRYEGYDMQLGSMLPPAHRTIDSHAFENPGGLGAGPQIKRGPRSFSAAVS